MFSPEASATKPGDVEEDGLVVAGLHRLALGEDRVHVLPGDLSPHHVHVHVHVGVKLLTLARMPSRRPFSPR